jgi:hypothetical protein
VEIGPASLDEGRVQRHLAGHGLVEGVPGSPDSLKIGRAKANLGCHVEWHDRHRRTGRNGPKHYLCGLRVTAKVVLGFGQVQRSGAAHDAAHQHQASQGLSQARLSPQRERHIGQWADGKQRDLAGARHDGARDQFRRVLLSRFQGSIRCFKQALALIARPVDGPIVNQRRLRAHRDG